MIQILRSWEGGPLREFSDVRVGGWGIRYDGKFPYAGGYFCDVCEKRVLGVHRVLNYSQSRGNRQAGIGFTAWLCQGCKPRKGAPEPKGLKKYREAKKAGK